MVYNKYTIMKRLVFWALIGVSGFCWYKQMPKTVKEMNIRIGASSPNDLTEERESLLTDFDTFVMPTLRGKPKIKLELLKFIFNKQRKLLDLRTIEAIKEIREAKIETGKIRIWHLYNMGIVVKTENMVVAFDMGRVPFSKTYKELVEVIDVLITSHLHDDHFDSGMLKQMAEQGNALVFSEGGGKTDKAIEIKSGEMIDIDGVKITAYQTDHRGDDNFYFPCGWFWVEVEGFNLLHTGDGLRFKNEEEAGKVYGRRDLDILLANIMIDPFSIRDLKPRVVIPLHLYELMHGGDFVAESGFDDVMEKYETKSESLKGIERMLLIWGESFELSRQ
ncbi:MAG: hypothetical protein D4S01_03630 [Dehalococcoidia bacterium]|nr:MAG: hypothetical protein D4S01_03630 [Dehalococcoidia bacterium]